MSVNKKYNYLEQAYPEMLHGISTLIQKSKLSTRFNSIKLSKQEIDQIQKAKELCELKIIELWKQQNTEEFKALCATYFDLASNNLTDNENEYFIYEQLKLISFGYLGEHGHFVSRYLITNKNVINNIDTPNKWNKRLLTISFKALVNLIIKQSWKDIDLSVKLIEELRGEQSNFEEEFLNSVNEESRPYGAAELVSLYYFSKSIEILSRYLIEGHPVEPENPIKYHIDLSKEFASKSGNMSLIMLFQFCEALFLKIIRNTIWYSTRGVNTWVTEFNRFITQKDKKGIFELLYPQRNSLIDGNLFNPANRAIIVNLPTSSGKTIIAQYRILQALNQFKHSGGWVAYVAPTKALVNQIFNQFNKEFNSIGLKVEKASGAIELDGFEQNLVKNSGNLTDFDVLVTTYEKLNLLVRQGLGTTEERPLVLTVVDEAHNIEDKTRGLNLEFLLTTINNDCLEANFMLMTPDISNSSEVAKWLAGDRGNVINIDFDWWQPNERVVGALEVNGRGRNYNYQLKSLHTNKGTFEIGEEINLRHIKNAEITAGKIRASKTKIASHISSVVLDINSPIIVLARTIDDTYSIAEELYNSCNDFSYDDDVELLIKFVESELGNDFPLVKYLRRRIGLHSSSLPDEVRYLIEDLMANGKLQALVATTTVAQGINFPASAVIMAAYNYPFTPEMPVRDFWNIAGRVGRAGQQTLGWVGLAVRNNEDLLNVSKYVKKASKDLISQLSGAIETAFNNKDKGIENWLNKDERWSSILQYISHLRKEEQDLDIFISQIEQKLQATLGYEKLSPIKKKFFRSVIKNYAKTLSVSEAERADSTGFSTISVRQMIGKLATSGITPNDWDANQLFSAQNNTMKDLVGIMLKTYEIQRSLNELNTGGTPLSQSKISNLIIDWVNGNDIASIANKFFPDIDSQIAIKNTTKALYKIVANSATWGLAALQQMPTSGVDWDNLSEIERKKMANLPAYLHYGVHSDAGVLMRKNDIPRSIAHKMGSLFNEKMKGNIFNQTTTDISNWLNNQGVAVWDNVKPKQSNMTGNDYKKIWKKLRGV